MRAPRIRNDDNNIAGHFPPPIRPKPVVKLNPRRPGQASSRVRVPRQAQA